jgi:hypothetical protein
MQKQFATWVQLTIRGFHHQERGHSRVARENGQPWRLPGVPKRYLQARHDLDPPDLERVTKSSTIVDDFSRGLLLTGSAEAPRCIALNPHVASTIGW